MLYTYKAMLNTGERRDGQIEAANVDLAINSLQQQGLIITAIDAVGEKKNFWNIEISFLERVSVKDVVILSRQLSTLFNAQVSALRVFQLIGEQTENAALRKHLLIIADDLKGGTAISAALAKHPKIFSDFYVNMIKAGEESGKLDEVFNYLADYLDRNYEVTSKAKSALIYPSFVIITFIGVMVLMFTVIIPQISVMIVQSGEAIPLYTQIVLDISSILIHYGIFVVIALIILGFLLWKYIKTPIGEHQFARFKIDFPYVGTLYRKLYLARIADNMSTMTSSGIPMLRALEITAAVVDNPIYKDLLIDSAEQVKAGVALSASLARYDKEVPGIMTQMIKVGEETGELGSILKTLALFYQREVVNAVDALVSLIEPVMIVFLGVGVGILMASVLVPIYNLASAS